LAEAQQLREEELVCVNSVPFLSVKVQEYLA